MGHDHFEFSWELLLWEMGFSAVWDFVVIMMLMPLIVKIVKHFVNKDRDARHGHANGKHKKGR